MLPFILLNVLFKNTINCLDYIVSVIDEWMNECVWSIGGMMLTGGNGSTLRKTCPRPLRPPQILLGLTCEWTRPSDRLVTNHLIHGTAFCLYVTITLLRNIPPIHSFMHSVVCPRIGPHPLPKRVLHRVWSSASAFIFQYPHVSLRSSSSFLHLLPFILVTSILPCIFPPITCFRMQFLCMMWPLQIASLLFIVCRTFLSSLTPCNTLLFFHMISPTALVHPSPAPHFKTFELLSLHCTHKYFSSTQD